jgi:hypothetical protein
VIAAGDGVAGAASRSDKEGIATGANSAVGIANNIEMVGAGTKIESGSRTGDCDNFREIESPLPVGERPFSASRELGTVGEPASTLERGTVAFKSDSDVTWFESVSGVPEESVPAESWLIFCSPKAARSRNSISHARITIVELTGSLNVTLSCRVVSISLRHKPIFSSVK